MAEEVRRGLITGGSSMEDTEEVRRGLFAGGSSMEDTEEEEDDKAPILPGHSRAPCVEKKRNLVGFWLLGLFNNFSYVIMLSAAHDLLRVEEGTGEYTPLNNQTNSTGRDCNPVSTGSILLADILPAILMKLLAPFIHIPTHCKVILVTGLAAGSFLTVSFAGSSLVTYLGVVCASLSSGLGEVTFLSYTHLFDPMVISAWSSGTGGAGVFGAGSYALLTFLGVAPRTTVLLMLFVPAGMLLTFGFVLNASVSPGAGTPIVDGGTPTADGGTDKPARMSLKEKLRCVSGLLKYMVPLGLVYFFEYLINQGLFEMMYFPASKLTHSQQYRWYQLDYQLGVLLSRSSLHFIKLRHIKLMAVLQGLNFVFSFCQSVYWFIPDISIVFLFIFWEGLLGGASYVNTFYRISVEVEAGKKEFSLGIASLADSVAIGLAGWASIYIHSFICDMPLY